MGNAIMLKSATGDDFVEGEVTPENDRMLAAFTINRPKAAIIQDYFIRADIDDFTGLPPQAAYGELHLLPTEYGNIVASRNVLWNGTAFEAASGSYTAGYSSNIILTNVTMKIGMPYGGNADRIKAGVTYKYRIKFKA